MKQSCGIENTLNPTCLLHRYDAGLDPTLSNLVCSHVRPGTAMETDGYMS
jgi:hypothetical protein